MTRSGKPTNRCNQGSIGPLAILTEKDLSDWTQRDKPQLQGSWEVIEGVVDSGAIGNVTSIKTAEHIESKPNEMSKGGMFWTAENGGRVYNQGEKELEGFTESGTPIMIPNW